MTRCCGSSSRVIVVLCCIPISGQCGQPLHVRCIRPWRKSASKFISLAEKSAAAHRMTGSWCASLQHASTMTTSCSCTAQHHHSHISGKLATSRWRHNSLLECPHCSLTNGAEALSQSAHRPQHFAHGACAQTKNRCDQGARQQGRRRRTQWLHAALVQLCEAPTGHPPAPHLSLADGEAALPRARAEGRVAAGQRGHDAAAGGGAWRGQQDVVVQVAQALGHVLCHPGVRQHLRLTLTFMSKQSAGCHAQVQSTTTLV
jgi:hypothetical protein